MSSSPTFIVSQTKEVEEELLAIDQGRSHTSSPRSRPTSRLEIVMMDLARSQTDMARCQEERARSIDQKIESLARALTEQTRSQLELVRSPAEVANIMGRISSVEKSLHGTPSPSPIPGRRGSSPSAETMHVSVPSTAGYLVPLSQSQLRIRSERLRLKPRPDYRLLNKSAIWQDRTITEVDEDTVYDDPTPIRRETQLKTVAGEMTFHRGPGNIVSMDIVREGQDVVVETRIVGPEVNIDLANNPLHPPNTSFRVAPEVEESIRREDVRRSRMSRTLMDTEGKRNTDSLITPASIYAVLLSLIQLIQYRTMSILFINPAVILHVLFINPAYI